MKALRFLDENIEKMLCVIALALMSAVIVAQVFCRYVLNAPFPGLRSWRVISLSG